MKRIAILTAALLATTACTVNRATTAPRPAMRRGGRHRNRRRSRRHRQGRQAGRRFRRICQWRLAREDRNPRRSLLDRRVPRRCSTRPRRKTARSSRTPLKANAAPAPISARSPIITTPIIDTAGIEQRGLAPLKPRSRRRSPRSRTRPSSPAMLGANMRADDDPLNATNLGTENLFGLFVTQALDRSDARPCPICCRAGSACPIAIIISPRRPTWPRSARPIRRISRQILTLAGISDPQARAERIFDARDEDRHGACDVDRTEPGCRTGPDPWTQGRFRQEGAGDRLGRLLAGGGPAATSRISSPGSRARSPARPALVASEPLQSWQDWLTFHRINQVTAVLPKAFDARALRLLRHDADRHAAAAPARQARDRRGQRRARRCGRQALCRNSISPPRPRPTSRRW